MTEPRICFAPRQLREFLQTHPALQQVILWVSSQWPPADMVIGDIHRNEAENAAAGARTEIHVVGPPWRACDVHVRTLPGDPTQAAESLAALVNRKFFYDPTRPEKVVAYGDPHGTGPHLHLQVCDRTILRAGSTIA